MQKAFKWGFCLLLIFAMMFAFVAGCNPADDEDVNGVDDENGVDDVEDDVEEDDEEDEAEEDEVDGDEEEEEEEE